MAKNKFVESNWSNASSFVLNKIRCIRRSMLGSLCSSMQTRRRHERSAYISIPYISKIFSHKNTWILSALKWSDSLRMNHNNKIVQRKQADFFRRRILFTLRKQWPSIKASIIRIPFGVKRIEGKSIQKKICYIFIVLSLKALICFLDLFYGIHLR